MRSVNIHFRRFTLMALCLLGLALIAGCLKAGLGDPEQAKLDEKLVGIWQKQSDGGEKMIMVVNQFDPRAYVVTAYELDKDRNVYKPAEGLFKAWLAKVGDNQFITLQFLGAEAIGNKAPDYYVAKIICNRDSATLWGVNDDFVKDKDTSNTAALSKVLSDNLTNEKAFDGPDVYNRLTPDEFKKLTEEKKN